MKDYRNHAVATPFGHVTVRLPRFCFTDGCSGLRRILAEAGVSELPILDWFHIGMRLQHLKQTASGLATDDPARVAAKAVIVEEVERLHWRLWNGKAKDAQISIDRIRAVMHVVGLSIGVE